MSDTAVLLNTGVAVAAIVVLIVRFRLNPVVALVLGSCYLGLSTGLGATKTVETITSGFGDVMAEIGLLIAFGVLIGAILRDLRAIERLVDTLLRVFGPRRIPYAMALTLTTALQSIFLDVLLVISAPLAKGVARRLGPLGTARMATALAIALECGIVFAVPGVGALALAGLLHVPLGKYLLFGLVVVVPTVTVAIGIMSLLFARGWWNPTKDELPAEEPVPGGGAARGRRPRHRRGRRPAHAADPAGPVQPADRRAAADRDRRRGADGGVEEPGGGVPVQPGGGVAAGSDRHLPGRPALHGPARRGARSRVRPAGQRSDPAAQRCRRVPRRGAGRPGLGDILGRYFSANSWAPLLLVWLMAAVLHVAVGSVTISAITSAGLLAPIAPSLGLDPVLIALAAGAGSLFMVHLTSNTFWLLQSLLGQTTRGALKTCTVGVSVASVVALGPILALSAVL